MKKLYEIYYQEVGETSLSERIYPFESDQVSEWETPGELMNFMGSEDNYPHGGIKTADGYFVTFEDGYEVKVTL
jgi:hypothetical protein